MPRYRLGPHPGMMTEPIWRRGFAQLPQYDLAFDLQAFYFQLDDARKLAEDFPRTKIILGNSAMPVDRGVDRCMMGANFPADGLYRDFRNLWAAYHEVTTRLSGSDRTKLFRLTAARVYRLAD